MNNLTCATGLAAILFATLSAPLSSAEAPIQVTEIVKSTHSWDGTALPAYPQGQPEIRILKFTIAAGATLPLHQHPVINAGVLLKGKLHVEKKSGEVLILNPGDPIVEVIDTWHFGRSIGEEAAEIMVFYAGIEGKPITLKAK
ncbi:cupin domain-containing protein [Pseudoalteromonas xiamenensis]|uniref:cupin domain-containing protein n=1 Tax=Pseudoalteromonas xiamenensis TaxID=882626 RepID=UPI0035EB6753